MTIEETEAFVMLGNERVRIRPIESIAVQADLFEAARKQRNFVRLAGACLGAHWASPTRRLRSSYDRHDFDVFRYGGEVVDELTSKIHGFSVLDVETAGIGCFRFMSGQPITVEQDETPPPTPGVEATENFTDQSGEESTSSR